MLLSNFWPRDLCVSAGAVLALICGVSFGNYLPCTAWTLACVLRVHMSNIQCGQGATYCGSSGGPCDLNHVADMASGKTLVTMLLKVTALAPDLLGLFVWCVHAQR